MFVTPSKLLNFSISSFIKMGLIIVQLYHLTTGIHSEECIVRGTYTNVDSLAYTHGDYMRKLCNEGM